MSLRAVQIRRRDWQVWHDTSVFTIVHWVHANQASTHHWHGFDILKENMSWMLLLLLMIHCCKYHKFHVHQSQAQIEIWHTPDIHLMFTWRSPDPLTITWPPDHHLTFPWSSPDPYLTLIRRFWTSPEIHLTFTWHSLTFTWHSPDHLSIIWPSPDPYLTLISSLQLKKSYVVVGSGWWVDQPITDPISGPSFDFTFTFGPELDNFKTSLTL